ncbi:MAG: YkgJ family cysteine cluster protein [Gammaproteobacteria bacterium]
MFYEHAPLHFECTQCGQCCVGGPDHHVFLRPAEAERIREYLGLSRSWFRRRYLRRLPDGDLVAAAGPRGSCVFLGADGRCRVYGARPVQCRTYPFWPEVVRSRSSWEAEGRRCEGIGRGAAVPLERVRAQLRRQRAAESGIVGP